MNEQTSLAKISEQGITPLLQPKFNDLVKMIGETQLKKETSFAIQAVNANDYLAKATPQSVAKAIWNIAITGLTLNPIHKLAYITPRSVKGQVEAVLMPSYQGLVKLITDTGSVKNVFAYPVYQGDEFEVRLGTSHTVIHNPKFLSKKLTHVYAVAILHDGSNQIEVMSAEEVNDIRDSSDGYKALKSGRASSAIWETYYTEMARKTVVKRICKYLPKTEKWDALNDAISLDNIEHTATSGQEDYIMSLLNTSSYDHEQRAYIEKRVEAGLTKDEAEKLITDLSNNQLDRISAGLNYSQTDIKNKIDKEVMSEQNK